MGRSSAATSLWTKPVLLDNGSVLIAGGSQVLEGEWPYNIGNPVASADLYVPSLQAFVPTQTPMTVSREHATFTKLADGRVLIAGGLSYDADSDSFTTLASAEIYDPDLLADSMFNNGFER